MATMGERLVTSDIVIKGRSKAADVHAELAAGWPSGASWPPAPEVAADRIRVRRIRRIAAVSLFVAGAIDLLSSVTAPLRAHLHLIAQYLPVAVVQAAGALTAIAGIGMIMLSRGILKGQRRSWLVAVALLVASLALHLVHAADVDHAARLRRRPHPADRPARAVPGPDRARHARHRLRHPRRRRPDRDPRRLHRGRGGRPGAPPPAPRLARRARWVRRAAGRGAVGDVPDHHRPLRLHQPAGRRPQPHRRGAVPADPSGGRPAAVLGSRRGGPARRRAAGPRHRAPARHGDPRLLRAARRQAVVLPPRLAGRLRRLRWRVPGLAGPHRPVLRARARVGLVPPLRGPHTGGASGSWAPARNGSRPTRRRACASSTSATRRWWIPGSSRSRAGR